MYSNAFYGGYRQPSEKALAYRARQAKAEATMRAKADAKREEYLSDPDRMALVAQLVEVGRNGDGFYGSLYYAYQKWGSLTEKQEAALRASFAKRDERLAQRAAENAANANSEYVGEIGQRYDFALELVRVFSFNSQFGEGFGHILKDGNGNVYAYFGQRLDAEVGDLLTMKATVKKHEQRDGVKQTLVNRPKVAFVLPKPKGE